MTFELHPQLAKDTTTVGDFKLCRLLLANDGNYPWLILVPRLENMTELHQLSHEDQLLYLKESNSVSNFLSTYLKADKINIAALGNMVPQLHIHHVARYKSDVAWPNPIWGFTKAKQREESEIIQLINSLKDNLSNLFV